MGPHFVLVFGFRRFKDTFIERRIERQLIVRELSKPIFSQMASIRLTI
jgi:hypothetical protein